MSILSNWLIKPLKWLIGVFIVFFLLTSIATTCVVLLSGDKRYSFTHDNANVNDVTQLNPIEVSRIIRPSSLAEISEALQNSSGPVSIGGGRFSQGGQIGYHDSLHFDMRDFKQILHFDPAQKEITVQPGLTWRDLQEYIDPHNLSIKIMQTYANFTIGGSLSVNAHGRYVGAGPLVNSVKSIKLALSDGTLINASPMENSSAFYGAIGGYGGLGIIVEATLQLTDNNKLERIVTSMPLSEYKDHFFQNVRNSANIVLHNADIYPPDYNNVLDVSWHITNKELTHKDRLIPKDRQYLFQPRLANFVARFDLGKKIRQHIIDPVYYLSDRVVWRNWEASYDIRELEPSDRSGKTFVLREYFIPVENFEIFVAKMREIFQRHDVNVLNVSIRHAHKDPGTLLAWASTEVFAFVVYYQQETSTQARQQVRLWSKAMIDAAIESGGTYYLPYQVHASSEQFKRAYPRAEEFFALKDRLDPGNRFNNQLWSQHYPKNHSPIKKLKQKKDAYSRPEGQTFLTIPEWYLVFNPKEYADFLEAGNHPSDFPFMASINEYWALYDRVRVITKDSYPENDEYMTMLKVIGISTTVEYMYKNLYESTIGRFSRWLANGADSEEDLIIQQAHRAYSDLIFDKAWYEFDFWSWVKKIWREPDFFGPNIIRKWERKLFFTVEYGFKAVYAKLIEFGAKTAYEEKDNFIYLSAFILNSSDPALPEAVNVLAKDANHYLLAVPRWGGFTTNIPKLASIGFDFEDISGNNEIVVSYILPDKQTFYSKYAKTMFSSALVSDKTQKRIVVLVAVKNLKELIEESQKLGYIIEHIYDY